MVRFDDAAVFEPICHGSDDADNGNESGPCLSNQFGEQLRQLTLERESSLVEASQAQLIEVVSNSFGIFSAFTIFPRL